MDATTAVDERGSAGGFNAAALAGKYLTLSLIHISEPTRPY